MENNEGRVKAGYSRIFLAVMAVLLCAAPCVALDVTGPLDVDSSNSPIYEGVNVKAGGTLNVLDGGIIYNLVTVENDGTLIVKPGADIFAVAAQAGSTVDIYGGIITYGIEVSIDTPSPVVTVYGTDFADSSIPISETQWTPDGGSDTLTGIYEGGTFNLLFYSSIPINLQPPTPEDPVQLIQALVAKVKALNLQNGIDNSLDAKLDAASNALDDLNENNDVAAINTLQAFINAVEAQSGNKILVEDSEELIADAQAIIDLLNT